jgi:hypothetical protein
MTRNDDDELTMLSYNVNQVLNTIPFNIIPLSHTSQQIICYIQSETFSSIVLCNSLF